MLLARGKTTQRSVPLGSDVHADHPGRFETGDFGASKVRAPLVALPCGDNIAAWMIPHICACQLRCP
jgi:hypothetical protein